MVCGLEVSPFNSALRTVGFLVFEFTPVKIPHKIIQKECEQTAMCLDLCLSRVGSTECQQTAGIL